MTPAKSEREKAHIEELLNAGAAELAERMKSTGSPPMIPAEAVEAAAKASWEKSNSDPWISGDHDDLRWADRRVYLDDAKVMLEAAAPYMLSHEREQARLAHLDAMVNRETKREELAQAWAAGHHDGAVDQMLHMENGGAKTTPNPYMLNTEGEK